MSCTSCQWVQTGTPCGMTRRYLPLTQYLFLSLSKRLILEWCGLLNVVWHRWREQSSDLMPPCHRVGSVVLLEGGSVWDLVGWLQLVIQASVLGLGWWEISVMCFYIACPFGQFMWVFGHVCFIKVFIKYDFPCCKGMIGLFLFVF